jgi:nitrite reductase/ring-hydroxylating ferredoxin subunit
MSNKTWIRIADSPKEIPFKSNGLAEVEADGKKICLGQTAEGIFAVAQKCPHAGGFLADGFLDANGNLTCPIHRYKFCMRNGRNVSGEGYYLKHWPVEVRPDGVFVEMETGLLSKLF